MDNSVLSCPKTKYQEDLRKNLRSFENLRIRTELTGRSYRKQLIRPFFETS